MKRLEITRELVEVAKSRKLSLEELAYLYQQTFTLDLGISLDEYRLRSLGYIDSKGIPTDIATELFSMLLEDPQVEDYTEQFEVFWKTFPSDDEFGVFPCTRPRIRSNKKATFLAWRKVVEEVPAQDLLKLLLIDIERRKSSSIRQNNLTFIKSPLNWLQSGEYLNFLDEDKDIEYGQYDIS